MRESVSARVILATTLTGPVAGSNHGTFRLDPTPDLVDAVKAKHPGIEEWWRNEFGFPIEQATASELNHIRKAVSLDAIRNRTAQGRFPPTGQGGGGLPGVGRGTKAVRGARSLSDSPDAPRMFAFAGEHARTADHLALARAARSAAAELGEKQTLRASGARTRQTGRQ